jgi:hypothetical protein
MEGVELRKSQLVKGIGGWVLDAGMSELKLRASSFLFRVGW